MKLVRLSALIFLFIFANNTVATTVPYDFGEKTKDGIMFTEKVLGYTMLPCVNQPEKISFDIWMFGTMNMPLYKHALHDIKRVLKYYEEHEETDWRFHHEEHHLPTGHTVVPIPKSSWLFLSGVALIGTIVALSKSKSKQ